jgi:hypothetical protein
LTPIYNVTYNIYIYTYIWVNHNDPTATSLESCSGGVNYPKITLIHMSDICTITLFKYLPKGPKND